MRPKCIKRNDWIMSNNTLIIIILLIACAAVWYFGITYYLDTDPVNPYTGATPMPEVTGIPNRTPTSLPQGTRTFTYNACGLQFDHPASVTTDEQGSRLLLRYPKAPPAELIPHQGISFFTREINSAILTFKDNKLIGTNTFTNVSAPLSAHSTTNSGAPLYRFTIDQQIFTTTVYLTPLYLSDCVIEARYVKDDTADKEAYETFQNLLLNIIKSARIAT